MRELLQYAKSLRSTGLRGEWAWRGISGRWYLITRIFQGVYTIKTVGDTDAPITAESFLAAARYIAAQEAAA